MKRWALLTGLAACATPSGGPERLTPLVHVDFVDNKTEVTAPTYKLRFGAAGTVRLPEQLAILGANPRGNVLGIDTCPRQSLMSASIYPGATAIGGGALTVNGETGSSDSFLELAGPAVARVRVTYSVPYACAGTKQHLTGEQTLTMFPDGRVVRRDTVTSSDTELPGGGQQCGCDTIIVPDSGYFFTLNYAFSSDAEIVDAMDRMTQMGNLTEVCAQWPDLTIGLRWLDGSNTRISPNSQPSFVLDMMTSSSAPFPVVANRTHTSMMMISPASTRPSCGSVLAQLAQPALMVGGATISAGGDGIYVDTADHSSAFTVSAANAVPAFALSVKLGDHAKITSTVQQDDGWYVVQVEQATKILWFPHGLALGETITIEPL